MTGPANPTSGSQADAVPVTRATSTATATGAALATADKEIPQGEDRGSKTPIKGDPKATKPQGAQAEPARFGTNGQVPHRTVATPSGPVPVGAVKAPKDKIEKLVDDQNAAHDAFVAERNSRDRRLTDGEISRASGAELRAIGSHRGYKLPDYAGTRVVRTAFKDAQDKDESLPKE